MNWHNLSEKDFDANIKRHVGNSNPPYDPASWEKMNHMLDLIAPNSNTGNGRLYELLIVLIVLSSFFFWNVSTFPENSMVDGNGKMVVSGNTNQAEKSNLSLTQEATIENHSSNKKSISTSENKGEAIPKKNLEDFDKNQASTSTSTSASNSASTNNNTSTAANTSSAASPISGLDSESVASTVSASDAFTFNGTNNERENASINNNNQALPTSNESLSYGSSGSTNTQRYYQSMLAAMGPDIVSQQLSALPSKIEGEVLIYSEVPPVIEKAQSPWLIGFGFAPDISMVGFSTTTKPGTNFAAIVELQLNRRWSIQSGVGFSKKNYQAAGTDYTPPEGFWYYGVVPDITDATCEVLEIPINARYYFNPTNGNRLFASTGLSSYLMLSEDYYYQYEKYNPHLVKSWSVRNENQHYFGIYNLSAGYQWNVSERWFLEVEPFIKIPLGGVGFGKVDLWSTGSWFAVKYNLR